MKAIIKPTFVIDVTDWLKNEKLTKKQKIAFLKEELSDFSLFMVHATYERFKDVKVEIK
jgi:hypothetical protein